MAQQDIDLAVAVLGSSSSDLNLLPVPNRVEPPLKVGLTIDERAARERETVIPNPALFPCDSFVSRARAQRERERRTF